MTDTVEGIDVSQYQGEIDWSAVAASGVKFVAIRVEIGLGTTDRMYQADAEDARKAGLLRLGYLYEYVRRVPQQDADKQMASLLKVHQDLGFELSPMVDCEPDGNAGTTNEEWAAATQAACIASLGTIGRVPWFYSFRPFVQSLGVLPNYIATMPLWLASYTPTMPSAPVPWASVRMWQYAGGAGVIGHVPGVKGPCDRDRFLGTLDELMRCGVAESIHDDDLCPPPESGEYEPTEL